jgi:hypothetical protein
MLPMPTRPDRSRSTRAVWGVLALSGVLTLAGVGCTTSSSSTGSTGSGAVSTSAGGARTLSTFTTIADLQKALQDKDITCKLEYPGLKDDTSKQELSICVIDGEQAYLRIWLDPSGLTQFLASPDGRSGTVAAGANWTITVASNPVADKIARALGGTAPSSSAAGTTSTAR